MTKVNFKKSWKFIVFPLVLVCINLIIVNLIMRHYLSDLDIDSFLSNETPNFDYKINSIFTESAEVNQESGEINECDITFPNINVEYGKIEINSVNLSAPLIFGDNDQVLKNGIGQYSGSYIPGYGGTILTTGHNYKFPEVENVKVGDLIKITTSYGIYQYKVSDIKILDQAQYNSFSVNKDKEQLIYYTCYPFNALGSISTRYFIYADYLSGPHISKNLNSTK